MSARRVTSLTNPAVKAARALHRRGEREASGLFLAEGLKIVGEALDLGHVPRILLYGSRGADHPLARRAAAAAGEALEVTDAILAKVSRRDNPQMVIGVFEKAPAALAALDPAAAPALVALHGVRDPGNLGAIVRTADAAGTGGVILVGETCDPWSVEAVRATMGSIFAVAIARASEAEFAAWRRAWPGAVIGTVLGAKTDYRAAPWRAPNLIVMGGEQAGLPAQMIALCDETVQIPMRGRADSLNLAVATGIVLYEAIAPRD